MQVPRRYLPSLSLLSAFEAAARTGSFTLAARELSLTQSAVSRQIKALEEQIGVLLFARERQTVKLTKAGEVYAAEVRQALAAIARASLNLKADTLGGILNLAILPTFGTRWLAPRLPRFLARNAGITINLTTRLTRFDFRLEAIDAAIHIGQTNWPGADMVRLRGETVIPACSPAMKAERRFRRQEDLVGAGLIHIATRPEAWSRYLGLEGTAADDLGGMVFDQFATVAQAAIAGLGVALLPTFLMEEEFASGRLVAAIDRPMESPDSYYLVWPRERAEHPPMTAFRAWLLEETASDRAAP